MSVQDEGPDDDDDFPRADVRERCPECGAPLPAGRTCESLFSAALLLEAEFPFLAGGLGHYFLVGTYQLQHARRLTKDAALALLDDLDAAAHLREDLETIRARTQARFDGARRVTRRAEDALDPLFKTWPCAYKLTVDDILRVDVAKYEDTTRAWAKSTVAAIKKAIPAS